MAFASIASAALVFASLQGAALAQATCEVCHLRNDHTLDVANPLPDLKDTRCGKYADNSCCSVETSNAIGDATLYGENYKIDRCYDIHADLVKPANFDKCLRWFYSEECLYECDVNAGKFRKELDCTDGPTNTDSNGWQITGMPLKASECDAMYNDCKDFHMCTCSGVQCPDGGDASIFAIDIASCSDMKFCRQTLGERLANGKEFCEKVWNGAFIYEVDEPAAYSIAWNDATLALDPTVYTTNPNNAVKPDVPFPANCPGLDATAADCAVTGGAVSASQIATVALTAAAAFMLL